MEGAHGCATAPQCRHGSSVPTRGVEVAVSSRPVTKPTRRTLAHLRPRAHWLLPAVAGSRPLPVADSWPSLEARDSRCGRPGPDGGGGWVSGWAPALTRHGQCILRARFAQRLAAQRQLALWPHARIHGQAEPRGGQHIMPDASCQMRRLRAGAAEPGECGAVGGKGHRGSRRRWRGCASRRRPRRRPALLAAPPSGHAAPPAQPPPRPA